MVAEIASSGSSDSVSRAYLRDGASPTDPLLKDGAATYTPGESVRAGGATSFLSAGLKSVDGQSSSSQTLSATRVYDAFGNVASSSGSWSGVFAYGGVYGYQEDATGLKLLGHRLYDPSTGRFLTRDPIEDGRNWYAYVENDPVNGADPSGLLATIVWLFDPEIPPYPPGESVDANVMWVRANTTVMEVPIFTAPADPDSGLFTRPVPVEPLLGWVDRVRPGGRWDYKRISPRYEDAGNFNFGATGGAMRFPLWLLLEAGGVDQYASGTNKPEWGNPFWPPGSGDDPNDQMWIRRGYEYYRGACER